MLLKNIPPSSKLRSTIDVSGSLSLPIRAVKGALSGPTLAITAGVHGCEYIGIEAARRIFNDIDPHCMKGNLIIIPTANPNGFYSGAKQIVPSCGQNLNRIFPGKADGTEAEMIAWALEQQLFPQADFLLDLHSGDCNENLTPLIFYPASASETISSISRSAASALPIPYRIGSLSRNGLYSYAAQCGLPSMILEIGGHGNWNENEVELCLACIKRLLGFLNICGTYSVNTEQKDALESVYEEASHDGLWYPLIKAGSSFKKGDIIGSLADLEGSLIRQIPAAFDGIVWYYTTSLGVREGDPLIAYGRVE